MDASTVHPNEIPLVDFLLIGGGLASATAAETSRAAGAEGGIAILSAEKTLPYHRPPLTKGFLLNGPDKTNILIHEEAFYRDRDIEIHLGARVCRLDVDSRPIETDGGAHCRFGKLLIATRAQGISRHPKGLSSRARISESDRGMRSTKSGAGLVRGEKAKSPVAKVSHHCHRGSDKEPLSLTRQSEEYSIDPTRNLPD